VQALKILCICQSQSSICSTRRVKERRMELEARHPARGGRWTGGSGHFARKRGGRSGVGSEA